MRPAPRGQLALAAEQPRHRLLDGRATATSSHNAKSGVPMHKWRLRAALALSLGLFTTAASSHSYDFDHNTWRADDGDGQAGRPRRQRVAYVDRTDGEEAEAPHRRCLSC